MNLRSILLFPLRLSGKTYLRLAIGLGIYLGSYALVMTFLANYRVGTAGKIARVLFLPLDTAVKAIVPPPTAGSDLSAIGIKTIAVLEEDVLPRIDSAGTVEYLDKVEISAKSSEKILRFHANEGDVVRKGQVLVQLDRTFLDLQLAQQRAAYQGAKAELGLAQEKYEFSKRRVEGKLKEIEKQSTLLKKLNADVQKMRTSYDGKEVLYKEGGVSREEYETFRTELISKEAAFRMGQKDLEIATIGFRDEDIVARKIALPTDPGEKAKALIKLNAGVEGADVEVAESKVKSAEASLASTERMIQESTILCPVDSVVASRSKSVGEQVLGGSNAAQAIMTVVQIDQVYSTMHVKESDLKDITRGLKMEFSVDVYPKEKFTGVVDIISPVIDPKTHTVQVKAVLRNPGLKLRPGMFTRASIITGKAKRLILLPTTAVLPLQDHNAYVFVVRNGTLFRTEVSTGRQHSDERVEIASGLKSGDLVALEKLSQLREGMRVQPMSADQK